MEVIFKVNENNLLDTSKVRLLLLYSNYFCELNSIHLSKLSFKKFSSVKMDFFFISGLLL